MSESAGSCGILGQRTIVGRYPSNPMGTLRDAYIKRKLVQQELRKNELIAKGNSGQLSKSEAMELAALGIREGLEKIARLSADSICYMA